MLRLGRMTCTPSTQGTPNTPATPSILHLCLHQVTASTCRTTQFLKTSSLPRTEACADQDRTLLHIATCMCNCFAILYLNIIICLRKITTCVCNNCVAVFVHTLVCLHRLYKKLSCNNCFAFLACHHLIAQNGIVP